MKILFIILSIFLSSNCALAWPFNLGSQNEIGLDDLDDSDIDDKLIDEEVQKQIASLEMKKTGVYWKKPDFSSQREALGWSADVFKVPPGMQERVKFWVDIYSKYTTRQVLLHDSKYIDIVYKILDFSEIENNKNLNSYQREREKKKFVKDEKRKVKEQLERIHKKQFNPSELSEEDRLIFEKFKFIPDKNKFIEAQHRRRLRMQLGQKDRFVLGIYFSGRYIREMEEIFKQEQVPIELTRLPFVESTFNLYAMSKVGASGIWQFMRSTGKLFKLKIDNIHDLRNDPLTATRAAAKLLRTNYKILKNWPLAVTGYNHGPQGVLSVARKLQTDDINNIVWNNSKRRFGFASENFYAEFLAALHVESNATRYFGRIEISPPLIHDDFPLPRKVYFGEIVQLAENIFPKEPGKDTFDILRLYNPYFSRSVIANIKQIPESYNLRVPKETAVALKESLDKTASFKPKLELKNGVYKVLPGDTLSGIAAEFGVKIKIIREANNLGVKGFIRPGQKLVIPESRN
ncbi:MAG: transglycosylase SLT domain-containing protein [Oligoflexia bacterium]|nr:transglycosylase SLT domain-containing protein [Oligoflexia bacterium]